MTRPSFDGWALGLAAAVATRADCTRAQHGAVIVDQDRRVIGTGYNGAPAGMPGCASANACLRGRLSYDDLASLAGGYDDPESPGFCIALHAEANAIVHSDRTARWGGTIYVTGKPCHGCRRLIAGSGLARAVWPGGAVMATRFPRRDNVAALWQFPEWWLRAEPAR